MPDSVNWGVCYLCGTETKNVNEVGNPICNWCERQMESNKEEIEDDTKYHQSICTHPPEHRREDGRCKFCNMKIKEEDERERYSLLSYDELLLDNEEFLDNY